MNPIPTWFDPSTNITRHFHLGRGRDRDFVEKQWEDIYSFNAIMRATNLILTPDYVEWDREIRRQGVNNR